MLGNVCEACGLEHVDDNTLQSHVSNNIKCRRKIQHSRAQRQVEAYRDALHARRGARPQTPVRYTNNNGGASASGGEVDPAAVVDEPDDPIVPAEESDGEESVISHIDDGFNTLIELYIFFREADLSRRELVKKLLRAFQHIAGFVTKPRTDEEDTKDVRHYSTPDTGKWCHEAQCYLEGWNFAETTWGNVFLACAADLLHVLDAGMLPRMGKCFMVGKSKPEQREFERCVRSHPDISSCRVMNMQCTWLTVDGWVGRRRKEQKKDTRASVVRIPGGATWFSSGANYAAFEHRGMMQVMPLLTADSMAKSKPAEKEKRQREVVAFVAYASFYKALVGVTKHTDDTLDDVRAMAVT
ncbi:unnamed protein product [Closterium sp. Naga37s-1]|nr:unnamed protein product [Closterium sp. Naga37s-1]